MDVAYDLGFGQFGPPPIERPEKPQGGKRVRFESPQEKYAEYLGAAALG
jgi:hypothetical protein